MTELVQCMKCRGYKRMVKECKNQEINLKYHGQHKTVNCESQEKIVKCINCFKVNSKLNMIHIELETTTTIQTVEDVQFFKTN